MRHFSCFFLDVSVIMSLLFIFTVAGVENDARAVVFTAPPFVTPEPVADTTILTLCVVMEEDSFYVPTYDRVGGAVDLAVINANSFILPKSLRLRVVRQSAGKSCSQVQHAVVNNVLGLLRSGVTCDAFVGIGLCIALFPITIYFSFKYHISFMYIYMYVCMYVYMYQMRSLFWHNRWSAVQRLTYQTKRNVQTCKKKTKHALFWGVRREGISLRCRQVTSKVPKPSKIFLSYSFRVEMAHFDMVRWKYESVCISSMSRDTLELILWKKAGKKMQRLEKEHFFREECFDRTEYLSNTTNKRCSRQVLQFRCSSSYFIKFYTWR